MSEDILSQARLLEELLPDALRTLFAPAGGDTVSDLPLSQMRVMRLLSKRPHSPGELANLLSISPQAVAQVLAKLELHGFVHGEPLQSDRRCKQFQLTRSGTALMAERHEARSAMAARLLSEMTAEHREALIEALQKLVDLRPRPGPSIE